MAWTLPTAIFFAALGLLLAVLVVWGLVAPSVPRKGFLPMRTTRGDRVFLGIIGGLFIQLGWIGLTEASQWGAVLLSLLLLLATCRWG
jgi:predicted small integral membrane protein